MKMQHSLLPLLLLAIVAVCSTNEIPMINRLELENFLENQDNDNTLNNRLQNRDTKKIFFKRLLNRLPILKPEISNLIYENKEDNGDSHILHNHNNKEYILDDYLTQELQEYPKQTKGRMPQFDRNLEIIGKSYQNHNVNEIDQHTSVGDYEKILDDDLKFFDDNKKFTPTSPLLILKIRLSYLANDINPKDNTYTELIPLHSEVKSKDDEAYDKMLQNDIESAVKVKREEAENINEAETDSDKNKKIKKRIFSLWSRLQGLHRGHELHHRRHLHAFYGLPDDGGGGGDGGALTAETRATFLRPPGSPLRWG
ncbi:uncharacterized protein LOC119830448 [Zerene cesonia]|uniref:uncharacterized protein LOC119830448 n=1 Tax=Zerene cesonia TaxID=33412 RepID=UPI0018E4E5E8|nr:uncharacterized protein LOC119830448 [Zerene cesonia]